jgi:hypothetical protein
MTGPQSFRTSGPLAPGELDRARQWGEQLGTAITSIMAADSRRPAPAR